MELILGAIFNSAVLNINVVIDEAGLLPTITRLFPSFSLNLVDRLIEQVIGLGLFRLRQ
jgi:hypothetical protein